MILTEVETILTEEKTILTEVKMILMEVKTILTEVNEPKRVFILRGARCQIHQLEFVVNRLSFTI